MSDHSKTFLRIHTKNKEALKVPTYDYIRDMTGQGIENSRMLPHITVEASEGSTVIAVSGDITLTANPNEENIYEFEIPQFGYWTITSTIDTVVTKKVILVDKITEYKVTTSAIPRYGFRISKYDANPETRVEYIFDAEGMKPARMNFKTGEFDYGDWKDVWFIKKNKPCMLKNDGTVDYYLDPDNYSLKVDGTPSDIENEEYQGNAESAIPLVWVYRYEDAQYQYEIVSPVKYDENYKAYAHTDKNGNICDYFYYGMFGGSIDSNGVCRSLSNKTLGRNSNKTDQANMCKANGDDWYIGVWCQRALLDTLATLISCSTDSQTVYGKGNCKQASGNAENLMLTTGTLNDKGQFYGYNDNVHQVKIFHIEKMWGDQWESIGGILNTVDGLYVKMTPENGGYNISDLSTYISTTIKMSGPNGGYARETVCNEYGLIPTKLSGSGTTYFCDGCYYKNGNEITYLIMGSRVGAGDQFPGLFSFSVNDNITKANWDCGVRPCIIPTKEVSE